MLGTRRVEGKMWKWGLKNRIEYNLTALYSWKHTGSEWLWWNRVIISGRDEDEWPPADSGEKISAVTLAHTPPHHPLEMRLQVDVSGSSLCAVSAFFVFFFSHTRALLAASLPIFFTVKVPTPDKETGAKTFLWPMRKKRQRKRGEKMEQERGKCPWQLALDSHDHYFKCAFKDLVLAT